MPESETSLKYAVSEYFECFDPVTYFRGPLAYELRMQKHSDFVYDGRKQPKLFCEECTVSLDSLNDLFIDELRDVLSAEKQLVKALPKMAKASTSAELRQGFETHLAETVNHVERLKQVFESIDETARAKTCKAMEGLIEEGSEIIKEEADPEVKDAALIAAAQKVEHYEIAAYGTLVTWANLLGHEQASELLAQTLEEEKATDQKLTELAETTVNESAASE
jgi:ferritin-like metal-binding protein YciE